MNKKVTTLIGVALLTTLTLTGCSNTETTQPVSTPQATIKADTEPKGNNSSSTQLALAQQMFPDVEAQGEWSKDDVQLAFYTAYSYVNGAIAQPYFADGEFVKANFPSQDFDAIMRQYFSSNGYADIYGAISSATSPDETISIPAKQTLMRVANIISMGDTYHVSEDCVKLGKGCFVDNKAQIGDITTTGTNSKGQLVIEFPVNISTIVFDNNNKEQHIDREYSVVLYMTKNIEKSDNKNAFDIVIDYVGNGVTSSMAAA